MDFRERQDADMGERKMSDTPRTDAAAVSGEYINREMDRYAHKFVLSGHMRDIEQELAELQNAFEDEVTAREQAESRLRDSCLEGRGDQEFPPCARAIEAEARAAAAYDLLREVRDCANACGSGAAVAMFGNNLLNRIDAAIKGSAT